MAEEKQTLNLSRQAKLVPQKIIEQTTLKVFGVGSIGSHFVKTAAKSGFQAIEVYDMDTVEEENIAAQAFDFEHLGMNKVDAMADIVRRATGVEIVTHHGQITTETDLTPSPNTVYCCFFDSFEGRQLIFDKLKDFPTTFVDGRIGQYNMRHYLIDCTNEEHVKFYLDTLDTGGVTSELECGEKASAPINVQIAGMLVMNIIMFLSGKDYEKAYIGNAAARAHDIHVAVIREAQK